MLAPIRAAGLEIETSILQQLATGTGFIRQGVFAQPLTDRAGDWGSFLETRWIVEEMFEQAKKLCPGRAVALMHTVFATGKKF